MSDSKTTLEPCTTTAAATLGFMLTVFALSDLYLAQLVFISDPYLTVHKGFAYIHSYCAYSTDNSMALVTLLNCYRPVDFHNATIGNCGNSIMMIVHHPNVHGGVTVHTW